jgi:hypothetical protein
MEHEPCGFLSDFNGAVNFPRTDSVLVVDNHPSSGQPLVESERGILENSSDLDGKLTVMVHALALPLALSGKKADILTSTGRASHDAIRPSAAHEIGKAVVKIGEIDDCFLQGVWLAHGLPLTHKPILLELNLICQVSSCRAKR